MISSSAAVTCAVSCQAHLGLLGQSDEVFLILLDAEDQIRDGFCLTQEFSLERGDKVFTRRLLKMKTLPIFTLITIGDGCLTDAAALVSFFFFFLSSALPLISPL